MITDDVLVGQKNGVFVLNQNDASLILLRGATPRTPNKKLKMNPKLNTNLNMSMTITTKMKTKVKIKIGNENRNKRTNEHEILIQNKH